ncbi:YlxR family protein [Actinomadura nitritigenes]|uniref:YlxR family protein n=2 Tax=Actinomadura nitritigenes TaxID=134602 RepID=A0ABS3QTA6_9ACTN|nr:YlxR family protein [Actinomadura nitritigenes]
MERGRVVPQRTCVGCRVRTAKSDLLRLVVVEGEIVPDPRGRLPGRGAHLHPDPRCLELAERRRAFPRAFRLPGPLDGTALRDRLAANAAQQQDGRMVSDV